MTQLTDTFADGPVAGDSLTYQVIYNISDGAGFHDAWAYHYYPGGGSGEAAVFRDAFTTQATMGLAMTQPVVMRPRWLVAYGLAVADALNLSSAFAPLASYVMREKVSMRSTLATQATMGVSIHEAARFLAFLDMMRSAEFGDAFHLFETVPTFAYRAGAAVREMFRLLEQPERMVVLRLNLPDGFDLSDDALCNFIYNTGLSDTILAEITYQQPGETVSTWAVNTRTTAVTQYTRFAFNSFAPMGRKFLAADDDGLYELNGPQDDNVGVMGRVAGGFFPPSDGKLGGFKGVYLSAGGQGKRSGGTWLLKLEASDGREYIYKRVSRPDLQTTKFDVGKGLRSRYFAWELVAFDGQDFDLDVLEFVPMVSGRRI